MLYQNRSDDALKTELEYLTEYVGRVFGKPLLHENFQAQLTEMIDQKIRDYVFQRYRDWTAPELAKLLEQWPKEPNQDSQVVEGAPRRRGRPPKNLDQGSHKQSVSVG